jgi:regulatory protein
VSDTGVGAEVAADLGARRQAATAALVAAEARATSGATSGVTSGVTSVATRDDELRQGEVTRRRGHRRSAPPSQVPPPPDAAGEGPEPVPEDVARAIVLKQLSMAPRSRQQLADKLRQRGCPDDVAARVLDRMEAVGLVDDEAYAQMLVRSKQATRGLAKRALAQELRGKGIDDETIHDALGSIDSESERALAEAVASKAMRRLAGLDSQVQARRLAGVLGRKGYPPSVVYAVVRDAVNEAPEHQRD